jgi:hypothetical protein
MPKAIEIANELRNLANALEREPDVELPVPDLSFYCKYLGTEGKPMFLTLARIFPRPLTKQLHVYDENTMEIRHKADALTVTACIERSLVCKLIEKERIIPAVYDCEPLLSVEEEESINA